LYENVRLHHAVLPGLAPGFGMANATVRPCCQARVRSPGVEKTGSRQREGAGEAARRPRGVLMTISDLGEFGLIEAIAAALPRGDRTVVGIGDDAAVLTAPDSRVVATTDLLVEGRHFRRDWSSAADIGTKAAAQNIADVAAMGAVPGAVLVGFAAPGDLAVAWARELVAGIAAECARAGATVAGGDVSSAESVVLAVTALGDLAGRDAVTRAGARPGDVLAYAGVLGESAAGLALLEAGVGPPAPPRSPPPPARPPPPPPPP